MTKMTRSVLAVWKAATLNPRARLPALLQGRLGPGVLVFPAAAGILQGLMRSATADTGEALWGMSAMYAVPLGALWGLFQLHVLAAAIWPVLRRDGARLPFPRVRDVVALAYVPAIYAFLIWLVGAIVAGPAIFVIPEPSGDGPLHVANLVGLFALYASTAAFMMWGVVILVRGVQAVQGGTVLHAAGTLARAAALLFVVIWILVMIGVRIYG
jgi:hypothetical protein